MSFQEGRDLVEQRLTTDYQLTRGRLMRLMRDRAASTAEIREQIQRATVLLEQLLQGEPVGAGDALPLSETGTTSGQVMAHVVLRQLAPQLRVDGAVATYQKVLQLRDIKKSVRSATRQHKAVARLQVN